MLCNIFDALPFIHAGREMGRAPAIYQRRPSQQTPNDAKQREKALLGSVQWFSGSVGSAEN